VYQASDVFLGGMENKFVSQATFANQRRKAWDTGILPQCLPVVGGGVMHTSFWTEWYCWFHLTSNGHECEV